MSQFLNSLRARAPWPVARVLLTELDFPVGQGWDKTISKANKALKKGDLDEALLEEAYVEHVLYGEKHVRLFDLEKKAYAAANEAAAKIKPPKSVFLDAYPHYVSSAGLRKVKG